jgi:structural maintenance of chromosome 3 (chondroitin sulfate proteoglycan 6)
LQKLSLSISLQDQALDSTYRSAVANMIKKQADSEEHPTQFIVSTFRPELVAKAERWFGISHQNKVSSLHPLSRKDALHFIANLMNEEEAVGEVTSVATSSRRSLGSRKRKGDGSTSTAVRRAPRLSAPA